LSDKDVREFANGHDFIAILNVALKELKIINRHITNDVIKTIIMSSIDTEYIRTSDLFRRLNEYYMIL
jgi:hypothetical protein